jgi:hypothetical protein
MLGREAEGDSDGEILQRRHLAVEPGIGVGAETVGPTEAGAQMGDAHVPHLGYRIVETMILEMEPLA